ncbi:hypothetical protein FJ970_09065 [Mesorhizobium sp. B2-1-8]|uniref:hypothetical protein n=1 Tax=Mesorhizobium sp. B2-1-8 TaxID=2589967 RepID=UPI0011279D39|nr:hypothetical protein [Mesorhizobium sp. B2-1-8]UCI21081.1 hypothetical protein FJ970_09065 [Mesorhizobium sp. B2-1-8]
MGWGNVTGQTGVGLDRWGDDADSGGSEGALVFTGEGHEIARELVRKHRQKRPEPSLKIIGPVVTAPGWNGPLSQADVDSPDTRAHYWTAKGF